MSGLRLSAKIYIAAVALAALGMTVFALVLASTPSHEQLMLALGFAGLMTVAVLFPIHFGFRTQLALEISGVFAAVLLFEPGIAMLVSGSGVMLAHVIRRRDWDETLFNGSQIALQAGVGGLILVLGGVNIHELGFDHPAQLLMVVAAAGVMYLLNTFSVAIIVGLQSGLSPLSVWRQIADCDGVEQLAQLALGLMAAAVVDAHPWALPLLLLPAFAIYRSSERHVQLRTQTVKAVESLADLVDIRDPYTASHSTRVAAFSRDLATRLELPPDEVDLIEHAARAHDIGKMLIDIGVLTKEGRLTDDEWEQLKRHPVTGAEILSSFPQFALATSFVRHHHERIDGKGYPDGLRGGQIPLGARVIAVADSFDAMSSARPYRDAMPLDMVLAEFRRQRGIQWDERVVDTLLELVESVGAKHSTECFAPAATKDRSP